MTSVDEHAMTDMPSSAQYCHSSTAHNNDHDNTDCVKVLGAENVTIMNTISVLNTATLCIYEREHEMRSQVNLRRVSP